MITEENISLGMIKAYCEENGVQLNFEGEIATLNGNQIFGDIESQTYFQYFIANKEEILGWANENYNTEEMEQTSSIRR